MTHVDSASRAGNATGDRVEAPASCGECIEFAEQIAAAFVGRKMTHWTDLRVLRRRHLQLRHPALYRAEMVEQYAAQIMHSEAGQRGRWVA